MKKLLLAGIISVSLGIFTGLITNGNHMNVGIEPLPYDENISEEEGIYTIPPANESGYAGGENSPFPVFHWETNSRGLREEDFSKDKPSKTTRILVIGDSMTWGSGVNRSSRYTDRLERYLNSNESRRYQVINAGVGAWGMKDYYLFLKNRGVNYDPDLVVIAFSFPQDALSRERSVDFHRKADAKVDETRTWGKVALSSKKNERIARETAEMRREFFQDLTFKSSNMSEYMDRMLEINRENNVKTVFFTYEVIERDRSSISNWIDSHNASIVWAPEELEAGMQKPERYRFKRDPHYNPEGHRLLAEKLFGYLRNLNSI